MGFKSLGIKREPNVFEGPATAKDMPKETFPKVDMPLDFISDKDLKLPRLKDIATAGLPVVEG